MITVAGAGDRQNIVDALVAAFVKDPVLRHLFPDDETYPRWAAAFFGLCFDKRVHRRTIWTINSGAATAIWEPPSPERPSPAASSAEAPSPGTAGGDPSEGAQAYSLAGDDASHATPSGSDLSQLLPADAYRRMCDYDDAVHAAMPAEPFWYLGVLGTHPDHTGRRWAQAVMHAGLDRAAADGLPAVLETSNPANVEFYRRAGWRVVNEIANPIPIWIMQR
ncbi:GNAT family N-acetyltransferase [Actinoplanes solisilvae]|uniref:GNAT family N-acetyltransferase n=1 Tax=Actinoplanes solisilvae TaxID=2486853 RepID=UPI00196A6448|nr:GNAT family N-acetyltransferase [Actinoplanes solisilvae]